MTHEITFESLDVELAQTLFGSSIDRDAGELLYFKNAILARAEVNKNKDGVTEDGIEELARTLPMMAITDDHAKRHVVGFFTRARAVAGALVTEGVIYARRFPEIAQGVRTGQLKLSIEAFAKRAKIVAGVRWLYELRAIGGGVTPKPAGSNTVFDRDGFVMIAHVLEETIPMDEQTPVAEAEVEVEVVAATAEVATAAEEPIPAAADEAETSVPEATDSRVAELEASLSQANEQIVSKDALIAELQEKLSAALSAQSELSARVEESTTLLANQRNGFERALELYPVYGPEKIKSILDDLGTLPENVFSLMASTRPEAPAPVLVDDDTEQRAAGVQFVFKRIK